MHRAVSIWVERVRRSRPKNFINHKFDVLNVGCLDINGSNKKFFACPDRVIGIDCIEDPSVDIVSLAHEYKPNRKFRTVISTSMLEHDVHWEKSLQRMIDLTEPGGLLLVSCAGPGWAEHCSEDHPSYSKHGTKIAFEHYKALGPVDLMPVIADNFRAAAFEWQIGRKADTFFHGIRV